MILRTFQSKNQEFHKHNDPQPKISCSYNNKNNMYLCSVKYLAI